MKKKIIMGTLGVIAFLLSACSSQEDDGTVIVENVTPTIAPAGGEENATPTIAPAGGEEETEALDSAPEPEEKDQIYGEIYGQVIKEKEGEGFLFSLIYLDDDEIPELVICDRGYGTYSVYTVKNGTAFCMIDSMATVEMSYFERKGVVSCFARWNGGGDEGGYSWSYYQVTEDKALVDGDVPVLHDSYDAVYDEEGNWTGEGITKYYHMDQEIDEASYQKLLGDLGIEEEDRKSCADHAYGKEEILDQMGLTAYRKIDGATDPADMSEEELLALLGERMEYYRKSAYYSEMTDYWENVREVRDIDNHLVPLYESDIRYLTKENLALDPPVVIHLAKNEIYARHGYIFRNQDLYNYFMGCLWYTPAIAPEDFSEELLNECEKENLKLLSELDTM